MQKLEKILEELEIEAIYISSYDVSEKFRDKKDLYVPLSDANNIIRRHMNDGWIPMEERLPEDLYTSSELYEKWFLITTPCGEEKLVQRMKCVPSGYVWHDGYDTHRAVAWGYIEPYKLKRREKS